MCVDPRHGAGHPVSARTFHLLSNAWGIGIGLLALIACLSYFLLPQNLDGASPAVQAQLDGWTTLYYAAYGVAGVCILVGLIARRPALDALGLCIFLGGLCVNMVSLLATLGPVQTVPALGAWLAYTIGATGRLLVVTRVVRERDVMERPIPLRDVIRMAVDE